MRWNNGNKNPQ